MSAPDEEHDFDGVELPEEEVEEEFEEQEEETEPDEEEEVAEEEVAEEKVAEEEVAEEENEAAEVVVGEGEEDEDEIVVLYDDYQEGGSKKKTRRNKNSKIIDYKTFQHIAKGGVSTNVKLGDEESEMNLRKFEGEISKDYLINFHPEIQTHNYDEIATLSTIVRNQEGQIVDNFHKTLPFVSKFEKARILGVRAKQINSGAAVMIDVPDHVIDGYMIAQMEYEQKKIPFIIKRPLPNGAVEYWKFADMEQVNL
jgi:DNA-directed RNA polymerase I, II, and III subunit RPABC2